MGDYKIVIKEPKYAHPRQGDGFVFSGWTKAHYSGPRFDVEIEGYYTSTGHFVVHESQGHTHNLEVVKESGWHPYMRDLVGIYEPGTKKEDIIPIYQDRLEELLNNYLKKYS